MAAEENDEQTDEHGLTIQKYEAMVLLVLPPSGYGEQTMRYARSALYNVHVGTHAVSSESEELIQGDLQDEFQVDAPLDGETRMDEYAGVLFAGGPGSAALADDPNAVRLAKAAMDGGKLVGAWGDSVAILARAGVLKGRKVTGSRHLRSELEAAGAKYTGNQVERDGSLVTAVDESAGMRFGRALVQVVAIL